MIADFDATLTRYWINGCRGQSRFTMVLSLYCDHKLSADVWFSFFPSNITCIGSHGLLQQGNPEYDAKRQALFEYYHPLEFSPTIPLEEKTKLMEEWYVTHHPLF